MAQTVLLPETLFSENLLSCVKCAVQPAVYNVKCAVQPAVYNVKCAV